MNKILIILYSCDFFRFHSSNINCVHILKDLLDSQIIELNCEDCMLSYCENNFVSSDDDNNTYKIDSNPQTSLSPTKGKLSEC